MTLATRIRVAFVLISAALPFVAALPGHGDSSNCNSNDFWFDERSCCLPHGGPPSPPPPPPEKRCPPEEWSWSNERSCCLPHHPRSRSHRPPRCDDDWQWSYDNLCCERPPHHPYPPPPQPSGRVHALRDHRGPSTCKNDEFWYNEKECCLPRGGPPSHPEPPPEKQCPPKDWSWSQDHDCCIPHQPPPRWQPPPRCSDEWEWSSDEICCKKRHPEPSGAWQQKRTAGLLASAQLCPMSLTACPIANASGLSGDFECLDTTNELESCGGCASVGEGQDCTAIKGAWNVGCERGKCAVYTCALGFKRSSDGTSCISA